MRAGAAAAASSSARAPRQVGMGLGVHAGLRVWVEIGGHGMGTRGHTWTGGRGAGITWARVTCQPGGHQAERWIQIGAGAEVLGGEGQAWGKSKH